MFRLFEREGKRGELLPRAEPDEPALAGRNVGLEYRRIARSNLAVDSIGRDDQIGIREWRQVVDFGLEFLLDAERRRPVLKNIEQTAASDSAKSVAAGTNHRTAEVHVDVIPVMKVADDCIVRLRIRRPESRHGLIRKHDAPAEGIVGPIALIDLDFHAGQRLFQQNRTVQARGTAAHEYHSLHGQTIV